MSKRRRKKTGRGGGERAPFVPMPASVRDELPAWIEEAAETYDLLVYGTEISTHGKNLIRIFVDTQEGMTSPGEGVRVDQCARVNRYLQALLDEDERMPERYTLEVSSPGVERTLKTLRQYELTVGVAVRLVFNEPIDEEPTWVGVLEDVTGERIRLRVEGRDEPIEVSFDEISRGRVFYDFDGQTQT